MISALKTELIPRLHRARFYGDLPMIHRILRFRPVRSTFYRQLWSDSAEQLGADCRTVKGDWMEIRLGRQTTYVRNHEMMLDSQLMLDLMGDKGFTHTCLSQLGVPLPDSVTYRPDAIGPALTLLDKHGTVVIKPGFGTGGGRGVTTGICDRSALVRASRFAARFSKSLVAEQQVKGANYRLLYLNGTFLDAVRRDPPCIVGDGRSNIRKLVKAENSKRLTLRNHRALSPLVIDRDALQFLARNQGRPGDVPKMGERLQVKQAVNENNRFENHAVAASVSPQIRDACGAICRALSVKLAGIDLYCHDIAGEFSPHNCTLGEVNTTPGLHHHYLVANPSDGHPVAKLILERMFEHNLGILDLNNLSGGLASPAPSAWTGLLAKEVHDA